MAVVDGEKYVLERLATARAFWRRVLNGVIATPDKLTVPPGHLRGEMRDAYFDGRRGGIQQGLLYALDFTDGLMVRMVRIERAERREDNKARERRGVQIPAFLDY